MYSIDTIIYILGVFILVQDDINITCLNLANVVPLVESMLLLTGSWQQLAQSLEKLVTLIQHVTVE